jgi:phosphoserine aminotransferase
MSKPEHIPKNPCFSSGPCAKRPNWSFDNLNGALLGRSHRSGPGKKKLQELIDRHRELLEIPEDYYIGIVPASDTGAIEMAFWNLLGPRPVDVLAWESFGQDWLKDIQDHLKLDNVSAYEADYGDLPDLEQVDFDHDVVFTWNGTTSGVRVPNGDWIADDREGLTLCDATSAVFAYELPWNKLDVTTWSWQKVLGGEAAHGMLVLSPRAVERLESYSPERPLPKIFRIKKAGKINEGVFKGLTINTPSMLAVEDCLDVLTWVKEIGGIKETIARSYNNYKTLEEWVNQTEWISFLAEEQSIRSTTSITLKFVDEWFVSLSGEDEQMEVVQGLCKVLEQEKAAYDIKNYRAAPPGLRIWGGSTVESEDIKSLTSWIEWAYEEVKLNHIKKAA